MEYIIAIAVVAVIFYAYFGLMTYKNPITGKRERWSD